MNINKSIICKGTSKMKVYVVQGGWHYDGSSIIHVSSTEELAEKWRDTNFKNEYPYPEDKKWNKHGPKWVDQRNKPHYYDFIEIEEWTVDGE